MNIQKTQNINFTGKITGLHRIANDCEAINSVTKLQKKRLSPLINYLKHHVPGNHIIAIKGENQVIMLNSTYTLKDSNRKFIREMTVSASKNGISKNIFDSALEGAKGINKWIRMVKSANIEG